MKFANEVLTRGCGCQYCIYSIFLVEALKQSCRLLSSQPDLKPVPNRFITYLLPLVLLCSFSGNAAAQLFVFRSITSADGLPSNFVNGLHQDSKGNVWFATDKGAAAYNGQSWLTLTTDDGLPSNMVYTVHDDERGHIWLATYAREGLSNWNGKFIANHAVGMNQIHHLFHDGRGRIYFSNHAGFDCLQQPLQTRLPSNRSYDAVQAGRNLFFASTPQGLFRIDASGSRVQEKRLSIPAKAGHELLMVHSQKLYAFGVEDPSFQLNIDDSAGSSYAPFPRRIAGYKAVVYQDYVYVAALTGLYRMKLDGTQVEHLNARFGLPEVAIINDILVDKHNNLWIATHGYGAMVWNADWITRTPPLEYPVQRLANDNGKIWIASNHHWAGWSGPSFQVNQYPFLHQATGCCRLADGSWLFSDLYTLFAGKDPTHISAKPIYANPMGLSSLCQWLSDTVFIATYGRGIVVLKDKKQVGVITSANGLCDDMVEKLFRLKNSVAASSYSKGLSLIGAGGKVLANISKEQGLPSNMVYFVGETGDSLLVGTRAGLSIFYRGKKLKDWSAADGLMGNKVINAFRDNQGQLWVVSDAAVFRVEHNRLVKPFEYSSLPQANYAISQSLYDEASSTLVLAVGKEVLRIDLQKIPAEVITPSLSWQAISVSGNSLRRGASYTFPAEANHLKAVCRLPYFLVQDAPILEYKLEGYDTGWHQTRFSYTINYPGLPAGQYQLQARLLQRDGQPAATQTVVTFLVKRVWWQQWWFITFTVLAAMVFTAFIINRRNNIVLKRQQEAYQARLQLQEEREMISRELHDNVGSQLTFLAGNLDWLQETTQHQLPAEAADMIASLSQSTHDTINDVRESIWALKKPQVSAAMLAERIESLVHSRFKNPNAPAFHFIKSFDEQMAFSPIIALNGFRIAQEALSNALMHSKATEVTLSMTHQTDNSLRIEIADNGIGISTESWQKEDHYGLENMQRRATEHHLQLNITTAEGKGTQVQFVLPAKTENNA